MRSRCRGRPADCPMMKELGPKNSYQSRGGVSERSVETPRGSRRHHWPEQARSAAQKAEDRTQPKLVFYLDHRR